MENKNKNNQDFVSILDDNGNIKSKEDFIKDVEKLYDTAAEEIASEQSHDSDDVLDFLMSKDGQVDEAAVLDSYDFYSRAIFLSTEITPELGTGIIRKIRFWNQIDKINNIEPENREPIKIYIDTPGGDVQAVFSIVSAIELSKTPIHTITYGCAYSGGLFIGISGHKRYGFANSSYLFHEGMTIDGGDAHKFLQHVDFYKTQLKKIKDITTTKTKITSEEYDARHKDDWFFLPSEALHYGIIDEILESF